MKRNAESLSSPLPTKASKTNPSKASKASNPPKRNETIIRARPIILYSDSTENEDKSAIKQNVKAFQVVNGYYQKEHFQKMQGGPDGLTSKLVFRSDIDDIISRCANIFAPGIAEKAEQLNITINEVIDIKEILNPAFMSAYQYQQLIKTENNEAANLLIQTLKKFDNIIDSKSNRSFKVEFLSPVNLNAANSLFFESLVDEICVPFVPGGVNRSTLPEIVTQYDF